MKQSVLSIISRRWRQLLGFALLFRVLESLLFAPMAALAGKLLLARTVLDSTAVVSFLLSPRGFLALTMAAVTALSIRVVEHAGLSAIFYGAFENRKIRAREALWLVWRQLLPLVRVSARFVGLSFLVALPLLAVVGGIAAWLLPKHDVNYYLKLRPPEFVTAAVIIGIAATATAAVLLSLIARWRWVVQVVLFQQKTAGEAFRESSNLTRGLRWKILAVMIGVVLVALALGVIASLAGSVCASAMLSVAGHSTASLAITFGLLLLLQTIFSTACTFLGSCLDAGIFTSLYRRRLTSLGTEASLSDAGTLRQGHPSGWLPIALIVGAVFCAASGTWSALNTLQDEQPISIHAHRGVTARAPENTLAAAREAIAARADYLEIDVQLSKDDVLVVTHDNDFSRLGGVAKKVWDLTYDEIRAIPLGARSAPEFRNEHAPTLDALLADVKGRIKVNIELKYYGDHQPGLARKVIEALRRHGMIDQVIIQCLEYKPLLEVRQLEPTIPIGYLLSFNARKPSRLDVDFLSVEQNRANRVFILNAHHRGLKVYAWTVNTVEDMQRMLDLGVDGLITDQSALARKTLEEYLSLPKSERAIRRVRSWLAE